ncbi:MAG: DUF4091 domain-containing protein [Desulfobacterales bacterium]|nr:DUF4091 domain-containing protein [Desulfobacterales bacterium]
MRIVILTVILFFMVGNSVFAENILHTNSFKRYYPFKFETTDSSGIQLFGAGNETVSFQVVINAPRSYGEKISVKFQGMSGSGTIGKENLELFLLENCQGSSYSEDCLIPISDSIISLSGHGAGYKIIWCDLYIPPEQARGNYQGTLTLSSGKKQIRSIAINLQVYPFSLPRKPSLETDLNNYGVKFVKKNWKHKTGTDKAYRIERALYSMARKHRMTFNPLPYKSQRGRPHPTMAPVLEGKGADMRVKDWTDYDKRYGPLFDGSAFEDNIPIDHQYLPFNPEWPSDFSNYLDNREIYEKEWEQIANEFVRHFREKGWNKTVFQVYMNQKPSSKNRIPWHLDEPKGVESYKALRYYADLTHRIFPQDSEIKVRFRIDISHFYCDGHKGSRKKDLRVNKGFDILKPVDIWVISKHSMKSATAQKQALKLKNMGKTVYEYSTVPRITESLTEAIQFGWNAWLRKEHGILLWNTVKFKKRATDGKDFIVYPGADYNIEGPVVSARLKAIRRGIQDYEYFRLASKYNDTDSLIKEHMTDNPDDYVVCRKKIAEMIIAGVK